MNGLPDARWKQRFDNYCKAFQTLKEAVEPAHSRELSDLEKQGVIQSFEFTHELAWKVLKDFLEVKGFTGLIGSKDATREAFKNALLEDGDAWMQMIADRNQTPHTYDPDVAQAVVENILRRHFPAFAKMTTKFTSLQDS